MGTFSSTGNILAQSSDPGALGAGAIWSDTNANITYRRNDANSAWLEMPVIGGGTVTTAGLLRSNATTISDDGLTLDSTETDSGESNNGTASLNATSGNLEGAFFTLPTTFEYYLITAVQPNIKTAADNMRAGVFMADADPITETQPFHLVALSDILTTATGETKVLMKWSHLIKGGETIYAFMQFESSTTTVWNHLASGTHTYRNTWSATAWGVLPSEGEFINQVSVHFTLEYQYFIGV